MPVTDLDEYLFQTGAAQSQFEFTQRRLRAIMHGAKREAEYFIRRDVRDWTRRHSKDGVLNPGAPLAKLERQIRKRFDDMIRQVRGPWPPSGAAPTDVDSLSDVAHQTSSVVQQWRDHLKLKGPSADSFLQKPSTKAVRDDHMRNVFGVRGQETRQLTENAARWRSSRATTTEVDQAMGDWAVNPGIFNLSTDSHTYAYARAHMGDIADAMGATHFVPYISQNMMSTISPTGRTGQILYRVLSREQLKDVYGAVNSGRKTWTSWRTLGLGHNTAEVYYPIPHELLEGATKHFATARKAFLAKTPPPSGLETVASARRQLAEVHQQLVLTLAASDVPRATQRIILKRLEEVVKALRRTPYLRTGILPRASALPLTSRAPTARDQP